MATTDDALAAWGFGRLPEVGKQARIEEAENDVSIRYYRIKGQLHQRLLGRLDLEAAEKLPPDELRTQLSELIATLIEEESLPINANEREQLTDEMHNEILGLGPLEPLLIDPEMSEVMVNGHFVDPMRVKLARTREIEGRMLGEFKRERDRIDSLMAKAPNNDAARIAARGGK